MKDLLFSAQVGLSLEDIAQRLGGEVDGKFIRCASPGRPLSDRSCVVCVDPARPANLFIYYCEGPISKAYAQVRKAMGVVVPLRPRDNGEFVRRILNETRPAPDTLVEQYLRGRGITLPTPDVLRFHPALKHSEGEFWPAMVAPVTTAQGEVCGIHRTWLNRDGSGKAPIAHPKKTLGRVAGGAIRLCPIKTKLFVAEGIETALSVMQASEIGAWSVISAIGLRAIELPAGINHVIVAADGDNVGEAAAFSAASRLRRQGRKAEIVQAPRGSDFNDLLIEAAR